MTNSTNSHAKFSNIFVHIYMLSKALHIRCLLNVSIDVFIYLSCKPVSLTFFKSSFFFRSVTFDMIKAWNTYLFAMKQ